MPKSEPSMFRRAQNASGVQRVPRVWPMGAEGKSPPSPRPPPPGEGESFAVAGGIECGQPAARQEKAVTFAFDPDLFSEKLRTEPPTEALPYCLRMVATFRNDCVMSIHPRVTHFGSPGEATRIGGLGNFIVQGSKVQVEKNSNCWPFERMKQGSIWSSRRLARQSVMLTPTNFLIAASNPSSPEPIINFVGSSNRHGIMAFKPQPLPPMVS